MIDRLAADGGLHPYGVDDTITDALDALVFAATRSDFGERLALSATVGNPVDLLAWLQGAGRGRPASVVAPEAAGSGAHLLAEGFVEQDGGMLFIGAEAEKRFGRWHFAGLTAVFTAPPQFTVVEGHREVGRVDPSMLTDLDSARIVLDEAVRFVHAR